MSVQAKHFYAFGPFRLDPPGARIAARRPARSPGSEGGGDASASALASDTAKAGKAYRDFLTLWKDADPILKQAKAEYARL
ncbi:MAG TPA: hypothetical protein VI455_20005 [Terriglobia bacterium]